MKKNILTTILCLICFITLNVLNGEDDVITKPSKKVFGISYDKAYLIVYKFPEGTSKHSDFFRSPQKYIQKTIFLSDKSLVLLDSILNNNKNFEDASTDISLILYGIVFIKNGEISLFLEPNLLGQDLGAIPYLYKPGGWSKVGINRFCEFSNMIMGLNINSKDYTILISDKLLSLRKMAEQDNY